MIFDEFEINAAMFYVIFDAIIIFFIDECCFFPNVFYLKMLAQSFFCQVRVYHEKKILKQRELRDERAGPWSVLSN